MDNTHKAQRTTPILANFIHFRHAELRGRDPMMLTVTFMGSRPRFIEKYFGMPEMYEIHALMGVVLSIMGVIHIIIQWNGFRWITKMSTVSQTGFLAVFSLIIVMFTGIFSLSGIFIYIH